MTVGALASESIVAFVVSTPFVFGGLAFGGPIVHWAHGNVGKGFLSLGINASGGALGSMIGAFLGEGPGGGLLGGFAGGLAANIIDATVLAYEERAPSRYRAETRQPERPTLLPTIDIRSDRASLGFAGTF
jgi:hypothetical protein